MLRVLATAPVRLGVLPFVGKKIAAGANNQRLQMERNGTAVTTVLHGYSRYFNIPPRMRLVLVGKVSVEMKD